MPASIRLSPQEQELIRKKCVDINKLLVRAGKEPIKDSELVHKIIEKTVSYVHVTTSGEIYIETE